MRRIVLLATAIVMFGSGQIRASINYDWNPNPGFGGTGFITLIPLGVGATDSDFTSSTVTDFTFTFDNGAPTITLSDLMPTDPLLPHFAIAGVLHWQSGFHSDPATFTDASIVSLVFATGSADYKEFNGGDPPLPFPQEVLAGSWLLEGTSPPISDPPVIPEPTSLIVWSLLAVIGLLAHRRRRA